MFQTAVRYLGGSCKNSEMAEKACKMFVLSNITSMEQTSAALDLILNVFKLFFKLTLYYVFLKLIGGANIMLFLNK